MAAAWLTQPPPPAASGNICGSKMEQRKQLSYCALTEAPWGGIMSTMALASQSRRERESGWRRRDGKRSPEDASSRERSRSSKSACRNDLGGLSLQEVTEQGEGEHRDFAFQRTPRAWSVRPGYSPSVELQADRLPQLLLLLKSFQADFHQACLQSHLVPCHCVVTPCTLGAFGPCLGMTQRSDGASLPADAS